MGSASALPQEHLLKPSAPALRGRCTARAVQGAGRYVASASASSKEYLIDAD